MSIIDRARDVAAAALDRLDERVHELERKQARREERTIPPGHETEYARRREAAERWQRERPR